MQDRLHNTMLPVRGTRFHNRQPRCKGGGCRASTPRYVMPRAMWAMPRRIAVEAATWGAHRVHQVQRTVAERMLMAPDPTEVPHALARSLAPMPKAMRHITRKLRYTILHHHTAGAKGYFMRARHREHR